MASHFQRHELDTLALGLFTQRLEIGDRCRQDRRLRVDGLVELLGGAVEDQRREWEAERRVGALEDRGCRRGALNDVGSHADVLGSLAGKYECEAALRGGARRRGLIELIGHTWMRACE